MYRKILLAFDPEDGLADRALPVVTTLAKQAGGEVLVLTARDTFADLGTPVEATQSEVDRVVGQLRAAGLTAHGEIRTAHNRSLAEQLVDAARAYGADLVAMGTHGRGSLGSLLVGSVSHEVVAKLDCPMLLVHARRGEGEQAAEARPIRRVMVAVDESDESQAALAAARELAGDSGASVLVVHALERAYVAEAAAYIEPDDTAKELLARSVRTLDGAGGRVESRVLHDAPTAAAIVQAADQYDADLIVLGSRRLTDLGGLLLGSVTHAVVKGTTRPVLVAQRAAVAVAPAEASS